MRFFIDSEFAEDGRTIEMISVALVAEGGKGYYHGVSSEFDEARCNDWVKANVLPHLPRAEFRKPRAVIAQEILDFIAAVSPAVFSPAAGADRPEKPEFWGYFADYDWVLLCQLYGPMSALPSGWPNYCRDLRQHLDANDLRQVRQPETAAHIALMDATWIAETYERHFGTALK